MQNRLGLTLFAGMLITAGAAFGQTATTAPASPAGASSLTFDVASVRPAATIDQPTMMAILRSGRRPETTRVEGSRVTYTYMSLKELISNGFKVRVYQVSGPDWLATDRFDIMAKMPDGATRDDIPKMLHALLVDRFKLAAHLETKEHPVIGLVLGKGGSKLKESAAAAPLDESAPLKPGEVKADTIDGPMRLLRNPDGSTTYNLGARGTFTLTIDGSNGTMHMTASGMTMKGFANMLTTLGGGNGRPVVDMTGLTGTYELAVDFSLSDLASMLRDQGIDIPGGQRDSSAGAASDPGTDTTVADALAKLGLKMERSKAMIQQLVVDNVEKTATEN